MEAKNNLAVAFTGHRKERILQGNGNNLLTLAQIKDAVVEMVTELYGKGYKAYYTGMANGFDMIAAEAELSRTPVCGCLSCRACRDSVPIHGPSGPVYPIAGDASAPPSIFPISLLSLPYYIVHFFAKIGSLPYNKGMDT